MTLSEAGETLSKARRAHSEAFLRYKALDPKRTDGVARAMADQDVDLVGAEVAWTMAKERVATQRLQLILEIVLAATGDDDAAQSTARSN